MINMIKKKMIDKGRDDFTTYLSEILGISQSWASIKMSGKSGFNEEELRKLNNELDFDPEEIKKALELRNEVRSEII